MKYGKLLKIQRNLDSWVSRRSFETSAMFISKKHNKSGIISIQIISKVKNKYKIVKIIGSSKDQNEKEMIEELAKVDKSLIESQKSMFILVGKKTDQSFIEKGQ